MKFVKGFGCALLVLALMALGAAGYLVHRYVWGPLPMHSGVLHERALDGEVEILRDAYGVPNIYATTRHDLFFAQGYTQAQDRWWQMELMRHAAAGRLGELIGRNPKAIGADVFLRTLGFERIVERELEAMSAPARDALQAFCDGVNAYIQSRAPEALALEYTLLEAAGVTCAVRPWVISDSLLCGRLMMVDLAKNRDKELVRAAVEAALPPEMAADYFPPWPYDDKPTVLKRGEFAPTYAPANASAGHVSAGSPPSTQLAGNIDAAAGIFLGMDRENGSNSWVARGRMTASGGVLLANDPHLGISLPSVWYQVGLHLTPESAEEPFEAAGFTLAAFPGIVIGHNARIAWGMTNVGNDAEDFYRIRVNPENPLEYEWNGAWRPMALREESIRFGDGSPAMTIAVRSTCHGPILNDNRLDPKTGQPMGYNHEDPMALRSTVLEPGRMTESLVLLCEASNWREFREALRYWQGPLQNFVYADIDGSIGYQMPGRSVIRAAAHSGAVPAPGWTDAYDWRGYVPFEWMPSLLNPARDFIATANQVVVPPEYYGLLEEELGFGMNFLINEDATYYGYRAERIEALLEGQAPHTNKSFQALQGDTRELSFLELKPYLEALILDDPHLRDVRDWLLEWEGYCDRGSAQAAYYACFWEQLMLNLFQDQLPPEVAARGVSQEKWAVFRLMSDPENIWWDDVRTKVSVESRDAVLLKSLRDGLERGTKLLGPDYRGWDWGELHTTTFVSLPLGRSGVPLVERLVNRGPFPTRGSADTINRSRWAVGQGDFKVRDIASMRMIVDLGDLDASVAINSTGQSGHPASAQYDDAIQPWCDMEYRPMRWSRPQVEAATVNRLRLLPAPDLLSLWKKRK